MLDLVLSMVLKINSTNLKILLIGTALFVPYLVAAQTLQVSRSTLNESSNAASNAPSINSNGRYIAFQSSASNLVSNDTNGVSDIFVHHQENITPGFSDDNDTRETFRVSVASDGSQANGASFSPSIARDAVRFVAFASSASNLVSGDNNGKDDIFIHDSSSGQTYRISVPHDNFGNVSGEADGNSSSPSISPEGCYLVFASEATNLNARDDNGLPIVDTNGKKDIFLYNNPLGLNGCSNDVPFIELISVGANGVQGNGDSYAPVYADIRFISFTSAASNLVSNDTNNFPDIFLRDRVVAIGDQEVPRLTILVSKNNDGTQANGESFTSSMVGAAAVFFDSNATNLVTGDTNGKRDIFKYTIGSSRESGVTTRISVNEKGMQANGDSFSPSAAGGDNYLAFVSNATNLAERSDCNKTNDIFVWDFILNQLRRVNLSTSGYQSNMGLSSSAPAIAYEAGLIAYQSDGILSPVDNNSLQDIYISVASQDPKEIANPLTKNEKLDEKPDVCVLNKKADVYMEYFSEIAASSDIANSNSIKQSGTCKSQGLCYQITAAPIKNNGAKDKKRDILRLIGKRNELSLSGLKPGNYNISFKVVGRTENTTISSNASPKTLINIKK